MLLLALAVFLRSKAPPEAARLLPESDGILYINFAPIRALSHFKDLQPPHRVPDYQQFVDATGIDWERDVDQVAIALHRMPDPNGPNGPVAYSMVIVGKITGKQPQRTGSTLTPPRAKSMPATPSTAFRLRTAPSASRKSATTWSPSPTRPPPSRFTPSSTAIAPPRCRFAGSSLLERHYHDVPLLSLAWGVGQIGLPFSESGAIHVFGFDLPLEPTPPSSPALRPHFPVPGSLGSVPPPRRRNRRRRRIPPASQAAALGYARDPRPRPHPYRSAQAPADNLHRRDCSRPLKSHSIVSASSSPPPCLPVL